MKVNPTSLILIFILINLSSCTSIVVGDYLSVRSNAIAKQGLSLKKDNTFTFSIGELEYGYEYVGRWHLKDRKVFLEGIFHGSATDPLVCSITSTQMGQSDLVPSGKRALTVFLVDSDTSIFTGASITAKSGKYVMGFDPILLSDQDEAIEIGLLCKPCEFNTDHSKGNRLNIYVRLDFIKKFDSTRRISRIFDYRSDGLYRNDSIIFERK